MYEASIHYRVSPGICSHRPAGSRRGQPGTVCRFPHEQFGVLYFPGGQNHGGFVSGVPGVTRLEPDDSGYQTHHRAALSLGGGYQFFLTEQLRLRLDLRGVYTALNPGGSAFCSGGCEPRFDSSGYLQVEAAAGLAVRL